MMAVFLEQPQPDETLFSLVEAYARATGVNRWAAFLHDLFGYRASFCASISFNLDHFASETRDSLGMSGAAIAENLTLYPYLKVFRGDEQAMSLLREMLVLIPGLKSRATLQLIQGSSVVRYCRICWAEDRRDGRRPYWRRAHQLPGVVLCVHHNLFLYERMTSISRCASWPVAGRCEVTDRRIDCDPRGSRRDRLLLVAEKSVSLLHEECERVETSQEALRGRARACGYGKGHWSVAARTISEDVSNFFGTKYLTAIRCPIDSTDSWVAGRLCARRQSPATLPYVLLDVFLSAQSINKPWARPRCLNRFAPHGESHPMDWLELRQGRYFALCRCGYGISFCVSGSDMVERRVTQYGFYFSKEARRLADGGLSLRKVASVLSVGNTTVRRLVGGDLDGPNCLAIASCRQRLGQEWAVLVQETGGAKAASMVNPALYEALVRFAPEYMAGGRGLRSMENLGKRQRSDL